MSLIFLADIVTYNAAVRSERSPGVIGSMECCMATTKVLSQEIKSYKPLKSKKGQTLWLIEML